MRDVTTPRINEGNCDEKKQETPTLRSEADDFTKAVHTAMMIRSTSCAAGQRTPVVLQQTIDVREALLKRRTFSQKSAFTSGVHTRVAQKSAEFVFLRLGAFLWVRIRTPHKWGSGRS